MAMRAIRIELEDDVFWRLYRWAQREHRKAHEQVELLVIQALTDRDDEPNGPTETAA